MHPAHAAQRSPGIPVWACPQAWDNWGSAYEHHSLVPYFPLYLYKLERKGSDPGRRGVLTCNLRPNQVKTPIGVTRISLWELEGAVPGAFLSYSPPHCENDPAIWSLAHDYLISSMLEPSWVFTNSQNEQGTRCSLKFRVSPQ